MEIFHRAVDQARFKRPELMKFAQNWLGIWIPMLKRNPMTGELGTKMNEIIRRNEYHLVHGWELGDENESKRPLNKKIYDESGWRLEERMAVIKDLTTDCLKGRIVNWKGPQDGKLPLFVRPKEVDPVTDEVLKYRVIRDGSCGSYSNPSINSLTPDSAAAMELVTHDMLQRLHNIYYLMWGEARLAKTDLEGAFRLFWLKPGESQKIVYKFAKRTLADLMNVWGTRTGSRICQDFTSMACRVFMLWENGIALKNDIDRAENADLAYFRTKLEEGDMHCEEMDVGVINLWRWERKDVEQWLEEMDFDGIEDITNTIRNGKELITAHRVAMKEALNDEQALRRLDESGFFEALFDLKIKSGCCIYVVVIAYVDDFMLFLPPNERIAQRIFEDFCSFLSENGLTEKKEKRTRVESVMELIGLTYDAGRMTVDISKQKRTHILRILHRGIYRAAISREEYEELIGKLSYCAQMAWPGKAFLRRMRKEVLDLIKEKGRGDHYVILGEEALKDWRWWVSYLDTVTEVNIIERWDSTDIDDEIYVDGATNGSRMKGWNPAIGIWWKGHYFAGRIPPRFRATFETQSASSESEFAIAHFEMLSIVVAFHNLRDHFHKGMRIMLRTDNKNCESALINKGSKDEFLCDATRWLTMYAVKEGIRMHVDYVNTKDNKMADWLSRFDMKLFLKEARKLCREKGWTLREMQDVEYPDVRIY